MVVEHFQESSVLKDALARRDRKSLFSSIAKIKEISQSCASANSFLSFMDAMLMELASSVFCDVICDVVHQYTLGPFDAYINYIHNMPYQEQTLHNLGAEKDSWVELLGGRRNGQNTVYEEWDTVAKTVHRCDVEVYSGQKQGELNLQLGDMINVMQKTPDGFVEGRRVQDGEQGWFSATLVEITNEHVQRRHLHQRYHVLQTATRLLKQHSGGYNLQTKKCFK
ncbi:hypothetical protein cypCar_00025300 [Cyprinus carpio]|nr:hypothetical protein cypCar_00025300 [Cyprinus carpio]